MLDANKDPLTVARLHISIFARPTYTRAFFTLFSTFFLGYLCTQAYKYLPSLIVLPFHGFIFMKLFIIFHDLGHGNFFPNKTLNIVFEHLLSPITYTPTSWTGRHNLHHKNSGNLEGDYGYNDTILMTVKEYEELKGWKKVFFRVLRDPLVFFTVGPFLLWFIYYRVTTNIKDNLSSLSTVLICIILYNFLGFELMRYHMIASYMAMVYGFLLFHLQHTYNPPYIAHKEQWSKITAAFEGSSHLPIPPPFSYFFMGINFHHIHHYSTQVPGYLLSECHYSAPEGLWESLGVHTLSWREIRNALTYTLRDSETNTFVPFPDSLASLFDLDGK